MTIEAKRAEERRGPWRRALFFALVAALSALACKKVLGLGDEPRAYDSVFVEGGAGADTDTGPNVVIELPGDAACGANRMTDPKNCGSCGHDCRGAACQRGQCLPEKVVELTTTTKGAFAVKDAKVYTAEKDTLFRGAIGEAKVDIATSDVGSNPEQILVDDTLVVWASYTNGLRACPVAGCPDGPSQISQTDKPVFGVAPLPGSTTSWPYVWLGESSLQTFGASSFVAFADAGVGEAVCTNLSANDTFVFFADILSGRIATIEHRGTSAKVVHSFPVAYPCAIFAHERLLFWTDVKSIWRALIEADGSISSQIALANEDSMPGTIVADADHVYWASTRQPAGIYRCNVDGCDGVPETFASGLPLVSHLEIDGPYLYFSTVGNDTAGTQIWRVAR